MKVALAVLALLAVATTASATYVAPWSYHVVYKWKCYIPGCDQCEAYNPYKCTTCENGYALLKDFTCGCAANYGSYVQPPQAGYPWYPPQSCPIWVKTKGSITKGTIKTGTKTYVSLNNWYHGKWSYCTQTYYPTKTCQGTITTPSYSYCQCFACPAGTNSTGGPITSTGCTPSSAPVTRCATAPPPISNANPWNPTKCFNLKPGKSCKTTCAAGFAPNPPGSNLTATCKSGGVWEVSGACAAVSAVCKGTPNAGANATAFTNCTDGIAGATCTSTCAPGFTGTVTATCNANTGKWDVVNTCKPSSATCAGSPTAANAEFLPDCTDQPAGATCDGTCTDGSVITATCGTNGKWTVTGTCNGTAACSGPPNDGIPPDNANPFETPELGECLNGTLGDICQASCLDGFTGGVDAICQADGWTLSGECTPGGGGNVTCPRAPADATAQNAEPWPTDNVDGSVCVDGVDGDTCVGSCATGFDGTASAFCTPTGWDVLVDCTPVKKRGTKGL